MYKQDLVLNNLQRLICHKTHPNNNYKNTQYNLTNELKLKATKIRK